MEYPKYPLPFFNERKNDMAEKQSLQRHTGLMLGSREQNVQQPGRDDLEPGYVEERFRVDRKKLEQMLQGSNENDENAEDFFQRVMSESNTQITWPSKLKIGAKSKKDPHIKIIGLPEDVKKAKEQILSILDTKINRVTLKMDVSFTDHSHVIGKGGNNIKKVMQQTGCHIHFPDSNRGNNIQEKSNQVSIAGEPTGVEIARARIRELLPIVYVFELPMTGTPHPLPDVNSAEIQKLQQQYDIAISFRQRQRIYVSTVIVRGTVYNAEAVKEGIAKLMELLTGNVVVKFAVSMQLEIAPQHHQFIIGRSGINIKQIMERTGASIHFPDPKTSAPQRKGTIYITGNIESVFQARQHLIGCLPLVLMFDVKNEIEIDQAHVSHLMEQLDVFISVKPKPKQPNKSVIVKSIERNSANMYMARSHLLGLKKEEKNFPDNCDKKLEESNYLTCDEDVTLSTIDLKNALHDNKQCISSGEYPKGFGRSHSAVELSSLQRNEGISFKVESSNATECPERGRPIYTASLMSGSHSLESSLNNSSQFLGSRDAMKTTEEANCTRSGIELQNLQILQNEIQMLQNLQEIHKLQNLATEVNMENMNTVDMESFHQNFLQLRAANDAELIGNSYSLVEDYEQKKLMATKAMQRKPDGETRNPTDIWSGMGFSKSMPESVIRERMQKFQGVLAYCEPTMETTYENPNENEELDIDPWDNSSPGLIGSKPMNLAPGEYPSPRKKCDFNDYLSSSNHVDSANIPPVNNFWDSDHTDLPELFSKLGLGKYSDLFRQQEIDLATFLTLTETDLRELGITTFGARRKMLLAIADLNKRRSLMNTESGANINSTTVATDFPDNGSNTSLRRDPPSTAAQRFSDSGNRSILDNLQMSPSVGKSGFSNPSSLMHSYTSPRNHGGNFSMKSQFLSQSARLSHSYNSDHNAQLMRGSGLSQSGSFNYAPVNRLFRGDRMIKTPPGFPSKKVGLNHSAGGNLFASSELYSHHIDYTSSADASPKKPQSDVASLSGRW
ncbi:protein bicaudal C homolog 1-like [Saccostrea echinata]|uniref:protein bicaudal C homolog 1-like n=1 Tax=Saccostrea echinata TaxID=191078 RepID=UPI002A83A956|nr:protein bicaudal C homolog 1-like [Saccostrea echinata]